MVIAADYVRDKAGGGGSTLGTGGVVSVMVERGGRGVPLQVRLN